MPSVGPPGATRSRSASSRPRSRSPAIALARRADAGEHGEVRGGDVAGLDVTRASAPSRPKAATTERTLPAP